jgi:hypothetical protein
MRNNLVYIPSIAFSVFLLLAVGIPLGQTAAVLPYTSGYNYGCADSGIGDQYINRSDKGPSSDAFMQGYREGFNACLAHRNMTSQGGSPGTGSQASLIPDPMLPDLRRR